MACKQRQRRAHQGGGRQQQSRREREAEQGERQRPVGDRARKRAAELGGGAEQQRQEQRIDPDSGLHQRVGVKRPWEMIGAAAGEGAAERQPAHEDRKHR